MLASVQGDVLMIYVLQHAGSFFCCEYDWFRNRNHTITYVSASENRVHFEAQSFSFWRAIKISSPAVNCTMLCLAVL